MQNSMNLRPKEYIPKLKKFVKEEPLLKNLYDKSEEIQNQPDSTPKKIIPLRSRIKKQDSIESQEKKVEKRNESISQKIKHFINVSPADTLHKEKQEEEIKGSQQKYSNSGEPPIMNGNELLNNLEEDESYWIIDQFIPIGLTILGARPKAGKSRLARAISMDIIFGIPFFNNFKTEKGGVLYLGKEESPRRVAPQIEKLLGNREIDKSLGQVELDNFYLIHGNNNLNIGSNLEDYIIEHHKKHPNLKLVVIDPLVSVKTSKDLEGYNFAKDYKGLAGLQNIAMKLQIGILVNAHTRKMKAENPFDLISGTLGVTAPADCLWVLIKSRKTGKTTLYVQGRERGEGKYILQFNNQLMEWEYVGEQIIPETTPEREDIIQLFIPDPNTELKIEFIMQKTGKSQANVSALIGKLKKEGILENGSRYGYYKLSEDLRNKLDS